MGGQGGQHGLVEHRIEQQVGRGRRRRRTKAASSRSCSTASASSTVPASSSATATPGMRARKARSTAGTKGWKLAELVKPSASRPSSPRAARCTTPGRASARASSTRASSSAAGLGWPHAARQALHQARAQLGLQPAQRPRQRRLLHVQPLGGTRDIAFFGQRHEGAQAAQIDHPAISRRTWFTILLYPYHQGMDIVLGMSWKS